MCKDTNFSANHNDALKRDKDQLDVYACAKILIFQQITTNLHQNVIPSLMFMLVQRY